MRLGAIFIAFCIVLIAASVGVTVYLSLGWAPIEAVVAALSVLLALGIYNTVATRLSVRAAVRSQLNDLFRGNADMARQVAEIGRRVAALEGRADSTQNRPRAATDPLASEIGELGGLLKQLAETVEAHEARIAKLTRPVPPPTASAFTAAITTAIVDAKPAAPLVATTPPAAPPAAPLTLPLAPPSSSTDPAPPAASTASAGPAMPDAPNSAVVVPAVDAPTDPFALVRSAIDADRIDLYLQPVVTLPQRKVRYYEALSRLRTEAGEVLPAAEFMPQAERGGLIAKIDNLMVFRCVQVVRRLQLKNRDVGVFCNLSLSTLTDAAVFQQLLDFLEANRAIAGSVVLEFTQSAMRAAGPMENESLSALADRGFRFSLDNLQDLRVEPRDLAARGFRFVKVPGDLLLNHHDATTDIHPADLSDLMGRCGIDLIAEKIETEQRVVDLLDYDVRFGQGLLFSPPRPVRAEALQGVADRGDVIARDAGLTIDEQAPAARPAADEPAVVRPVASASTTGPRTGGLAQLARGIASRI